MTNLLQLKRSCGPSVVPILCVFALLSLQLVQINLPSNGTLGHRLPHRYPGLGDALRNSADALGNSSDCDPPCGTHGDCVSRHPGLAGAPRSVCLCRRGNWGESCENTAEEWEQRANLGHHRDVGKQGTGLWWYLNSTPYRMRYTLAASMLRNRHHILEVGGFVSPIDQFLQKDMRAHSVTVIDPLIIPFHGSLHGRAQILHLPTSLDEFTLRGDEDAIIFLGMVKELKVRRSKLYQKVFFAGGVKTLVIEGAKYNPIIRNLMDIVDGARGFGFQVKVDMTMDFSDMVGPEHPEIPSEETNRLRRFIVLERP